MRTRIVLAIILLAVGLCFVPVLGYGEIKMRPSGFTVGDLVFGGEEPWRAHVDGIDSDVSLLWLDVKLNNAKIQYIMHNPTNFLNVDCYYDPDGRLSYPLFPFPEDIDTKGKIVVLVTDNRGAFYLSGVALLDEFTKNLKIIYSFLNPVARDRDTDVVALFCSEGDIPLGYFYQGEYHLWKK
ncbi:hypothetical protein E3J95_01490 [Candidatus Aerophobetes bacterium]|uniref:Uncharacterized protein n=1 Tax=Aerophobetes bacterium TaxID=2030807 RepID=A0A523QLG4_UNCAE|nr:MAG: hypothetical protein E3J95_01490 [Candidatus Aerophobetes bacterium]